MAGDLTERLLAAEDVIRAAKGPDSSARTTAMIDRYEREYGPVEQRRSRLLFACGCTLNTNVPAEAAELLAEVFCPIHQDAAVEEVAAVPPSRA